MCKDMCTFFDNKKIFFHDSINLSASVLFVRFGTAGESPSTSDLSVLLLDTFPDKISQPLG